MNKHYELLMGLSQAPDGQIAAVITPKFVEFAQRDVVKSDDMLAVIDQCVYSALASDFAMAVMDKYWRMLCEDEGITPTQGLAAAKARRDAWEATQT
jgi:hypothetical protein